MPQSFTKAARAWLRIGSLLAIVLVTAAGAAPAPPSGLPPGHGKPSKPEFVPGELLMKFRPAASKAERDGERGSQKAELRHEFRSGAEHWKLPPGQTTEKALEKLRRNPKVEYAEPNYVVTTALLPNDPMFPDQYALRNSGQSGGKPGADVSAESAWSQTTGSRDIVIAVIDTGVDYTHPDLAANIYVNPGEIPANGVDDDQNGFVDDVHGWDFINRDNDPMDDNSHGTHCAGIIGAVGDNGEGIAGVNWRVRIMPLKFLGRGGSGTTADAIRAIEYATLMGVGVMSNSWAGGGYSQALADAITAAGEHDILFVAAAGNDFQDIGVVPTYPAAYDLTNMIVVAATDRNDLLAPFSNYNATKVHLGAPGVAILSTLPGGRYGAFSGTSMACPHVAGAAALVLAEFPSSAPPFVKQHLLDGADRIPSLAGKTLSGGRLNVSAPLIGGDAIGPASIDDLTAAPGSSNSAILRWTATGNDGRQGTAYRYDLRYSLGALDETNFADATVFAGSPSPAEGGTPQEAEVTGLLPGTTYFFALKTRDSAGNVSPLSNVVSSVTLPPPTFASSPPSFDVALLSGRTTSRTLTLTNAGEGTLDWSVQAPTLSSNPAMGGPVPEEAIGAGAGGPDAGGYRYIDSDQPGGPPFSWIDLSKVGSRIFLRGDDNSQRLNIGGGGLRFYGDMYNSFYVCTNGFLSFVSADAPYQPQPLPGAGAPEAMIAPFWDDLIVSDPDAGIDYMTTPTGIILQYTNVRRRDGSGPYTFQVELQRVVLDPNGVQGTADVIFRYLHLGGPVDQASVGIQDASRTVGLQVSYKYPYLHDGLAIRLSARSRWVAVTASSGRLRGGESRSLDIAFDASGLRGGTYDGGLTVLTNDPLRTAVEHPIRLTVTDAPALWANPTAIDFGGLVVGEVAERTLEIRNVGSQTLAISGATGADPAITSDLGAIALEPARSRLVTVRATPLSAGPLVSSLIIASDDPVVPSLVVPVQGTASPRPSIQLSPGALEVTVPSSGNATTTLRITNSGEAAFPFTVAARDWPAPAGAPFGPVTEGSFATPPAISPVIAPAVAPPADTIPTEMLPSSPVPVTCLVGDPKRGVVYGHEISRPQQYRFSLATMTWERLASTPSDVNGGQCFQNAVLLHDKLYMSDATHGGFLVYDIESNTWSVQPAGVKHNYYWLATDGDHTLYLSLVDLFAFDTLTGKAEVLPTPPIAQVPAAVTYFEGFLYRIIVIGASDFMRYDIAQRRWEMLAPAPQGIFTGFSVDPVRREYLALGYANFANYPPMVLYRYSIDRGTWSTTPIEGLATIYGGNLAYLGGPRPSVYVSEGLLDFDVRNFGRGFVRLPNHPDTLVPSSATGVVPPGGFVDLPVEVSAAGHDAGLYEPSLTLSGTDPGGIRLRVPARVTVTGTPDAELLGQAIVAESSADYEIPGAATHQSIVPGIPPTAAATLELMAIGEYGTEPDRPPQTATVSVEGRTLGSTEPLYWSCYFPVLREFPLAGPDLAAFLADGRMDVTVQNSSSVHQECEVNRHLLRLKYDGPTDRLDFGAPFVGAAAVRSVRLRNNGTGDLVISAAAADRPEFAAAVSSSTVGPGHQTTVEVSFRPAAEGAVAGTLAIDTNDPDTPEFRVALAGSGAAAPIARVAPPAISAALRSGERHDAIVTLSNDGPSPLSFRAGIEPLSPSGPTARSAGQPGEFETLHPSPEPLAGLAEDPDASFLYAQAATGTGFYRYRVGEDRWESLAPAPIAAPGRSSATYLGGRIYTAYELGKQIGVYDVAEDTWSVRQMPGGSFTSTTGTDGRYLYIINAEHQFWRYDPVTGQTDRLPETPERLGIPNTGILRALDSKLYFSQASGVFEFHSYDVSTGYWKILAQQVEGPVMGMAIDPLARQVYTYGLHEGRNLMRYEIDTDVWSVSQIPTFPIDDGGLAWLPRPRPALYFLQGKEGTGLARLFTEVPFAGVSPASGVVPAGGSVALQSSLSAEHVPSGVVRADLHVDTDDPAHARLIVPMTMEVTPFPVMVPRTERLDFGALFMGLSRALTVRLENRGTAPLVVTMTSDRADVAASPSEVSVPPEADIETPVVFTPRAPGALSGLLSLATNDPLTPLVQVPFTAEGVAPPRMSVAPEGLSVSLLEGRSETRTLRLTNDGFSALDWSATVSSGFLSVTPSFGQLDAPGGLDLVVGFDGRGVAPGVYETGIALKGNDPLNPAQEIPVSLEVLPDADRDEVQDPVDNCPRVANARQEDRDFDGVGDVCDVCPGVADTAQVDSDTDGVGDTCDDCVAVVDPLQADADGDGAGDLCDNCVAAANAAQEDTDHDGLGDACDNCPSLGGSDMADGDADGVGDACDNCPATSNGDQSDSNGDGSGDACQPSLSILGVRQDGGADLEVFVDVREPQGENLTGRLEVVGTLVTQVSLRDEGALDCGLGLDIEGRPGKGIGFAFVSIGYPALFDLDSALHCDDGATDYVLGVGACDDPATMLDVAASLEGVPLPAPVCVVPFGQPASSGFEIRVLDVAPDRIDLEFHRTVAVVAADLLQGLPRRLPLAGLIPGTTYALHLMLTDGNTVPVFAASGFLYAGESALAFDAIPVAVASGGGIVECIGGGGMTTLDGAGSTDRDSSPGTADDIAFYRWYEAFGTPGERLLGSGATLSVALPLGTHALTLLVTDLMGASATADLSVSVVDTEPPSLSVLADPGVLLPPNHELRTVRIQLAAQDRCGAGVRAELVSVASSEPDDAAGTGDGGTTGDIQGIEPGTADGEIRLRAERSGHGPGRVYTLTYRAVDAAGNSASALATVTVPHDQGAGPDPLLMRLEPGSAGSASVRIVWPAQPGAQGYDVIEGDLASLHLAQGAIRLGTVRVLARGTPGTTLTEGSPVHAPAIGKGFFYLIESVTAAGRNGFGSGSTPWPRIPEACEGGCPGGTAPPGGSSPAGGDAVGRESRAAP